MRVRVQPTRKGSRFVSPGQSTKWSGSVLILQQRIEGATDRGSPARGQDIVDSAEPRHGGHFQR
jgi:hypothetical protein